MKRSKSILIVDDSKMMRMAIRKILEGLDIDIFEAENGVEALQRLGSHIPSLITLDLEMPIMDGLETCEKIRQLEKCKNIPILMMTSESNAHIKAKAFSVGITDYFSKKIANQYLGNYVETFFLSKKPKKQFELACLKTKRTQTRYYII